MSLSQDGFNFAGITQHSLAQSVSREPVQVQQGRFFGVSGESHIVDSGKGLEFTIEGWLENYASPGAVQTAFSSIYSRRGRLTGTLTLTPTIGAAINYPQATFTDVFFVDPGNGYAAPFAGGTTNPSARWVAKIVMTWRQTGLS